MIAKNVGIRRARGQFILATNIDIIFSDALIQFLARGELQRGRIYRVDRYDVPSELPGASSLDDQLEYCREHVIRVHTYDRSYDRRTGEIRITNPRMDWRYALKDKVRQAVRPGALPPAVLHTNGCGDFTLMHREHWFELKGYPEFPMYSFYLDALLCHAAHHSGVREEGLRDPARIYHIEHGVGSGWTPEGAGILDSRLRAAGVPQMSWEEYYRLIAKMRREHRPMIFNDDGWGLAQEELSETIIEADPHRQ